MTNNKTIEYTQAGRDRLAQLEASFREKVEKELRERKRVPGDEAIEVTAADIDELDRAMSLRFHDIRDYQLISRDLIVRAYAVIGVVLFAAGVFYPMLSTIRENPTQLMLLGTGLVMGLGSYMMHVLVSRRQRMQEMEAQFERIRELRQRSLIDEEALRAIQFRLIEELAEQRRTTTNEHITKP